MQKLPLNTPKEITSCGKTFVISKIPAMDAVDLAARVGKMVTSKLDNPSDANAFVLRILSFCDVVVDEGRTFRLDNNATINNHVNLQQLRDLLKAMWEYNVDFLDQDAISNSWDRIAQNLPV